MNSITHNQINVTQALIDVDTSSLLGLSLRTWKDFTGIINYEPNTIKLELMYQTGTVGLQSFKMNVRPSLLKEQTLNLHYL